MKAINDPDGIEAQLQAEEAATIEPDIEDEEEPEDGDEE